MSMFHGHVVVSIVPLPWLTIMLWSNINNPMSIIHFWRDDLSKRLRRTYLYQFGSYNWVTMVSLYEFVRGWLQGLACLLAITVCLPAQDYTFILTLKVINLYFHSDFPRRLAVTHTENHWSTKDSMLQYVDELLVPWLNDRKETLKLPKDQKSYSYWMFLLLPAQQHFCQSLRRITSVAVMFRLAVLGRYNP